MRNGEIRRIGVLTGGGDAPGLNAVLRAVVKAVRNMYGWEVVGIEDGFEGLLNPEHTKVLTNAEVRGILPRGGTVLGTNNRGNPFAYRGDGTDSDPVDLSQQVIQSASIRGLDAVVVPCGGATLAIATKLFDQGL